MFSPAQAKLKSIIEIYTANHKRAELIIKPKKRGTDLGQAQESFVNFVEFFCQFKLKLKWKRINLLITLIWKRLSVATL